MGSKVFKPRPFIEPEKGEVQNFWGWTEVKLGLNYDDVIINLIINQNLNIDIKFIKLAKLTNISIYVREI